MNLNEMTLEEMNAEIERTAKRVNQRIAEMEKREQTGLIKNMMIKGGELAQRGNPNFTWSKPRFSRSKATTVQIARARLTRLKTFESYKATTARGRRSIEKAKKRAFEKKLDTKLTDKQYFELIGTLSKQDLYNLDSDQVVDLVSDLQVKVQGDVDVDSIIKYINSTDTPVEDLDEYINANSIINAKDFINALK